MLSKYFSKKELFKLETELLQLKVDHKDTEEIERRIWFCKNLRWKDYKFFYGKFH